MQFLNRYLILEYIFWYIFLYCQTCSRIPIHCCSKAPGRLEKSQYLLRSASVDRPTRRQMLAMSHRWRQQGRRRFLPAVRSHSAPAWPSGLSHCPGNQCGTWHGEKGQMGGGRCHSLAYSPIQLGRIEVDQAEGVAGGEQQQVGLARYRERDRNYHQWVSTCRPLSTAANQDAPSQTHCSPAGRCLRPERPSTSHSGAW